MIRKSKAFTLGFIDLLALPFTGLAGFWMVNLRRALHRMPLSRRLLRSLGVLPLRHHYYEPLVYESDLRIPLDNERAIAGLDLNLSGQLALLDQFDFNSELLGFPREDQKDGSFYYHNRFFEAGDAEFLFNMVRHYKPARVIEVGAGFSTLMIRNADLRNTEEDPDHAFRHQCIEPNENPWLEKTGAEVIRSNVEACDISLFRELGHNDILFIQGDVLFEFLEILGSLNPGVIVHVHDIFTPKDYPKRWVVDEAKLFNEQYLLEAFLSFNDRFTVIASLNHLWHNQREILTAVCPVLATEPEHEPSSFWFVRNEVRK
jgi:hypothetical protein